MPLKCFSDKGRFMAMSIYSDGLAQAAKPPWIAIKRSRALPAVTGAVMARQQRVQMDTYAPATSLSIGFV